MGEVVNPQVLRKLRSEKGWSLAKLAEKSNVNKQTIHRLEQGQQIRTHEHTLNGLSQGLGVNKDVLLGKEERPTAEPNPHFPPKQQKNVLLSIMARNALALVAQRYGVTASAIVELAPFLFFVAAERSLQERRAVVSIENRDLCVRRRIDSDGYWVEHDPDDAFPFGAFLSREANAVGVQITYSENSFDCPEYRICVEETLELVGNDAEAADLIISGEVPLPPRAIILPKERAEWVRQKHAEWKAKSQALLAELDDIEV